MPLAITGNSRAITVPTGPISRRALTKSMKDWAPTFTTAKSNRKMPSSFRTVAPTRSWSPVSCRAEERIERTGHKPGLLPDHLEGRDQHVDEGIPDRQCRIPKVEQPLVGNRLIRCLRQDADQIDDDRGQARCQLLQDRTDPVRIGRQGIQDRIGCLDDGRGHQGCELVGILLEEEPDKGQFIGSPSRNGGRFSCGRQPQGLDLLPVLLDAFRPQIEERDQLRTNPLAEELDRQLGLLCPILHAGKLGGDRPEGIDGQDLLTGLQPDVLQDARQRPRTFRELGRLACPLANDLAIVAEARDDLDGAA